MALDFPSLAEIPNQNPENTYSPTSTPKSTDNGLTYIWNGNSWDLKLSENLDGGGDHYTDADVDRHLNKVSATDDSLLSWSGTDYAWVSSDIFLSAVNDDTAAGEITFSNKVNFETVTTYKRSTVFNDNYSTIIENASSSVDYGLQIRHFQGDTGIADSSIIIGGAGNTRQGYIKFGTSDDPATAATTKVTVDPSGNVGIGVTSPSTKLDVDGDITVHGDVTLNAGTGRITAGKGFFGDWIYAEPEFGLRMNGSSKNRIELRKEDYITGIQMNPGGSIRGLEVDHQPTQLTSDSKAVVVRLVGTALNLESDKSYAAYDTTIDNQNCAGNIIGYRGSISANMNSGAGKAYNMYCSSNAPVYVKGNIEQGGGSILQEKATNTPAVQFNGTNNDENFSINNSGIIVTRATANNPATGQSNILRVNGSGQVQAIASLRSLMTDVEPIENIDGLAIVQQLQLKRWTDVNDGEVGIGFIADDVFAAGAQSIVSTDSYNSEIHGDQPTTFGAEPLAEGAQIVTNYSQAGLIGVLVEAIKQLDARLEALEGN